MKHPWACCGVVRQMLHHDVGKGVMVAELTGDDTNPKAKRVSFFLVHINRTKYPVPALK